MGGLIALVDLEGGTVEDVVEDWLWENEDTWRAWVEG